MTHLFKAQMLTRFVGLLSRAVSMSSESHWMFSYGTLKRGQPNHSFLMDPATGSAEFISEGRMLQKYPLVIASKYNIPYLIYEEGMGYNVEGEIYKVDDKKRDFLDDFEGHPQYYERMLVDILILSKDIQPKTCEGTKVSCWVYFLKKYKPGMLELPMFQNYDSHGSHGLPYVESEPTRSLEDT